MSDYLSCGGWEICYHYTWVKVISQSGGILRGFVLQDLGADHVVDEYAKLDGANSSSQSGKNLLH